MRHAAASILLATYRPMPTPPEAPHGRTVPDFGPLDSGCWHRFPSLPARVEWRPGRRQPPAPRFVRLSESHPQGAGSRIPPVIVRSSDDGAWEGAIVRKPAIGRAGWPLAAGPIAG